MAIIELHHPTDPRYLLVDTPLPDQVTIDDLGDWKYGKPLIMCPGTVDAVYQQPSGFGTPWVRP